MAGHAGSVSKEIRWPLQEEICGPAPTPAASVRCSSVAKARTMPDEALGPHRPCPLPGTTRWAGSAAKIRITFGRVLDRVVSQSFLSTTMGSAALARRAGTKAAAATANMMMPATPISRTSHTGASGSRSCASRAMANDATLCRVDRAAPHPRTSRRQRCRRSPPHAPDPRTARRRAEPDALADRMLTWPEPARARCIHDGDRRATPRIRSRVLTAYRRSRAHVSISLDDDVTG